MSKYILILMAISFFCAPSFISGADNSVESISVILLSIEVNEEPSLFILVAEDGTLNRMGRGTVDNAEKQLFIERTEEPYFKKLKGRVRPYWLDRQGVYDIPDKKGESAKLTILFGHRDGSETVLIFLYGSESLGPPADICDFVAYAVTLTDEWYDNWMNSIKQQQK